jgi:hypothetical protein
MVVITILSSMARCSSAAPTAASADKTDQQQQQSGFNPMVLPMPINPSAFPLLVFSPHGVLAAAQSSS